MDKANSTPRNTQGIRLSDQQRLNWLRLIRSENIGPASFRELIGFCGSAANALERLPELSRNSGKRAVRICSIDAAEREIETVEKFGARLIGMGEPDYPPYLRQCVNPPPLIIAKGGVAPSDPVSKTNRSDLLHRPPLAIVGARNASASACTFTARLVHDLAQHGYVIVSGLARGIDASAHRASLQSGTIAVLAGGLDQPYPPENLNLFHEIPENGGMVLTEMPMGWQPRARDFPRRNRLIAGISLGLAVIEAAARSGSLISARLAAEMGRLVFAVPGSPLDPRANGTNYLLKNGATLLTEADDIIQAFTPMLHPTPMSSKQAGVLHFEAENTISPTLTGNDAAKIIFDNVQHRSTEQTVKPTVKQADQYNSDDDRDRKKLLNALSTAPVSADILIRHTGLSPSTVHLLLLELDLAGELSRHDDGSVSLFK